ncbi:MAG: hypothetical protein WAR81_09515, partial [Pseudomonadales bacterium]
MAIARKAAAKKPAAKKAAVKKVAAKKPAAKKARAVKKKPRLTIGERIMKLEQDAEKQLKQMANALEK